MPRLLSLNLFVIVLAGGALLQVLLTFLFLDDLSSITLPIVGICFLLNLGAVIKLGSTYNERVKVLERLNDLNGHTFVAKTYAPYMNAPCTRRVVICSLNELGRSNEYGALKREYQKHFFVSPCKPTPAKVTIHQGNQPPKVILFDDKQR